MVRVLAMIKNDRSSWVGRWQRMEGKKSGYVYALKVHGRLPEEVLEMVEGRGIRPVVLVHNE